MSSLNPVDYGMNNYRFEVRFRIDVLDVATTLGLVDEALGKRKFATVSKDGDSDETNLMIGDGNPENPFFQLRISQNTVTLWAGWHVSYERWQSWRAELLTFLQPYVAEAAKRHVNYLLHQHSLGVPADKHKPFGEVVELRPMQELLLKFLPEGMLHSATSHVLMSDQHGRDQMAWWPGSVPGEHESLNVAVQRNNSLETESGFQSWEKFLKESDDWLLGFHKHYLPIFLRDTM